SLNIKSRMARDLMESENFDPLTALMKVAKNKRLALELRVDAMKSLLPFCWPKLSVQEVNMRSLQLQATADIDQILNSLPSDQAKALEAVALKLTALPSPDVESTAVIPTEDRPQFTADAIDIKPESIEY